MSKSAEGVFKRDSASTSRIYATFEIDTDKYAYSATVTPSLPAFTSTKAILSYDDKDQLTATRSYTGTIGQKEFKLKLDNGVTIEGELDVPGMPGASISGSGNWSAN